MSIKDYFYFTKSQRNGLILLIVLIIACIGTDAYLSTKSTKDIILSDAKFEKEVEVFYSSLVKNKKKYKHQYNYSGKFSPKEKQTANYELFPFDPNDLDSISFLNLGLKTYQVKNIMKYRSKGGRFRTKTDFSKLYGLSDKQYKQLENYIQIEEQTPTQTKQEIVIIELNMADSASFCSIKGIHPKLAKRIISYRTKLGGFIKPEQISEVWGITNNQCECILKCTKLDTTRVQKIAINKASIDKLRQHPYINFYQAKAIYEERRNKGKLMSIMDLKNIEDESIDTEFINKISPYIEFESHF